jgi:long-chain acyl-CoA synthetase
MAGQNVSPPEVAAPPYPTEGPGAGTLPGLLRHQAEVRPDDVAIREQYRGVWREFSWADYLAQVTAVALGLEELGIRAEDRVGIIADNEPAWLFADLGTQSLGAWSVAVYPTQVRSEVGFILSDGECRVAFCGDQEQADKVIEERDDGHLPILEHIIVFDMKGVTAYSDPMITPYEDLVASGASRAAADPGHYDALLAKRSPEDIAFVGYTSGTTGRPKGAMLRHRNQVTMAGVMTAWADFGPDDRILGHFPLPHPAVRVTDAYSSLYSGASLNFPESPEHVASAMFELAPTFILATPRVFEVMKAEVETRVQRAAWIKRRLYRWGTRVLRQQLERELDGGRANPVMRFLAYWTVGRWVRDKLGLLKLRYSSCGGASVSPELLKFFWAMGIPIMETYGQSETSGVAFSQRTMADRGTAGWVLPGLEARIGDNDELLIRGDGIFAGYLGLPDKTAEAFVDGEWYRTGDIARFDEAGRLIILDREKHVIHTAEGQELSPSEIENTLKLSPYVCDAMAIGEGRPFVSALIQLEYETVADWAQRRNIAFTTFKSLTEHPEVQDLIIQAVDEANELLPESRRVRDHRLLPRELDPDLDEVTPTNKIKRNVVSERFGHLIEDMYDGSPARDAV